MAARSGATATFEATRVVEPIYTGGGVALSNDGQILATCLGEDVLITDLSSGERLAKIEGDGEAITTLCLTPAASHLITCSRSLSLRAYSLRRSETLAFIAELTRTLRPHSSPVITSAVDQTGALFATGAADGIVKIWDIRGGFVTHTLQGHSGLISALLFMELESNINGEEVETSKKRKRKADDSEQTLAHANRNPSKQYRLASGSEDGQIRIWDLQRRRCAAVLKSHVSVVRSLSFSSLENGLLSSSRDKTVIFWDCSTWKAKVTLPVLEEIEAAGFTGRDDLIYTGGERGIIRVWSLQSREEVTAEQETGNEGESILNILSDGERSQLLSVHADYTLLFHSLAGLGSYLPGSTVSSLPVDRKISGTHDDVIDLAYVGGSDEFLAVATNLEELRIVSVRDPTNFQVPSNSERTSGGYFGADAGSLKGHEDTIICLDVDWSGHWIATGSKDNSARLWRVDPERDEFVCVSTFTGHAGSLGAVALPKNVPLSDSAAYANPLQYPPKFLVTGSQDKTVKKWDVSIREKQTIGSSRATYTRKAHDRDINALDIHHNSALFASASQDRTVKIWSLEDGEAVGILRGHKRGVWSVKFAPKDIPSVAAESGQQASAKGLVLTGSGDKSVKLWSLTDYSCLRTFEGHTNSVLKVLWLPPSRQEHNDGNENIPVYTNMSNILVASAAGDGLVKVWNANKGETACTLDNHTDRVWALAVPPSREGAEHPPRYSLVSGGGDSVITFWTDTTATTTALVAAESTQRVEQDQHLQNLIRSGSYRNAITLALALDHPARLLSIFTSAMKTFPPEQDSITGVRAVDDVLEQLSDEQFGKLLLRIRDWNANARTSSVAQKVLAVLVSRYPVGKFLAFTNEQRRIRGQKHVTEAKEVLDALKAYTDRHYKRIEALIDESFVIDYTLEEMDELGFGNARVNGAGPAHVGEDAIVLD